jgi:hypothetical protein
MDALQELEERVRQRGVRVEQRLALLRLLREEDARPRLAERERELHAAVTAALRELRGGLAG